jgi:hypothetical protein
MALRSSILVIYTIYNEWTVFFLNQNHAMQKKSKCIKANQIISHPIHYYPSPFIIAFSHGRCSLSPQERRLAENLAVGKLPNRARESITIRGGIEVCILESLWHRGAVLRVVAQLDELGRIDVLVIHSIVGIDLDGDVGREVELAVERASSVARFHAGGSAELVDPGGAGGRAIKTGLDAVALVLDLRKGQVDLGDDAGDIEAFDIWVNCQYEIAHELDLGGDCLQRMQPLLATLRLEQMRGWAESPSRTARGPAETPMARTEAATTKADEKCILMMNLKDR